MKRLALAIMTLAAILAPQGVHAAASLKIAPLEYRGQLQVDKPQTGYVEVSNPGDATVTVEGEVQAFRQIGKDGGLQFYDDKDLEKAVVLEVKNFQLGPREAARIRFFISPNYVGRAGLYGAVLFHIAPPADAFKGATIGTTVRVGTLLIMNIGDGVQHAAMPHFDVSPIQLGDALSGTLEYANLGDDRKSIAFNPKFFIKGGLIGKTQSLNGPLVMPGSSRLIEIKRKGSYIGFVPLEVKDMSSTSAPKKTVWVFAITGYWRWLLPLIIFILFSIHRYRTHRRIPLFWRIMPAIRFIKKRLPKPRRRS